MKEIIFNNIYFVRFIDLQEGKYYEQEMGTGLLERAKKAERHQILEIQFLRQDPYIKEVKQ